MHMPWSEMIDTGGVRRWLRTRDMTCVVYEIGDHPTELHRYKPGLVTCADILGLRRK